VESSKNKITGGNKEDIETLRKQINAKRKELAALYRSDKTDKAIINKKDIMPCFFYARRAIS